tara:strand:- start:1932 stop:3029 length:1098 start_codon:yes stop_codon:yes gene_type:complete
MNKFIWFLLIFPSFVFAQQLSFKCEDVSIRSSRKVVDQIRLSHLDTALIEVQNWEDWCYLNYPIQKGKVILQIVKDGTTKLKYNGVQLLMLYDKSLHRKRVISESYSVRGRANSEYFGFIPVGGLYDRVLDSLAIETMKDIDSNSIDFQLLKLYTGNTNEFVNYAKSGKHKDLNNAYNEKIDSLYNAPDYAFMSAGLGIDLSLNSKLYTWAPKFGVKLFEISKNKNRVCVDVEMIFPLLKEKFEFYNNGLYQRTKSVTEILGQIEYSRTIWRKRKLALKVVGGTGVCFFSAISDTDTSAVFNSLGMSITGGVSLERSNFSLDLKLNSALYTAKDLSRSNIGLRFIYHMNYNRWRTRELRKLEGSK